MSCHIVSDRQIFLVASIYHENRYSGIKLGGDIAFYLLGTAKTLLAENYKSYNTRYKNEAPSEPLDLRAYIDNEGVDYWLLSNDCTLLLNEFTVIEKLKIVQNYNYQACESEDYKDSQAKKIVNNCISSLIAQLPGYDAAPWGIT